PAPGAALAAHRGPDRRGPARALRYSSTTTKSWGHAGSRPGPSRLGGLRRQADHPNGRYDKEQLAILIVVDLDGPFVVALHNAGANMPLMIQAPGRPFRIGFCHMLLLCSLHPSSSARV